MRRWARGGDAFPVQLVEGARCGARYGTRAVEARFRGAAAVLLRDRGRGGSRIHEASRVRGLDRKSGCWGLCLRRARGGIFPVQLYAGLDRKSCAALDERCGGVIHHTIMRGNVPYGGALGAFQMSTWTVGQVVRQIRIERLEMATVLVKGWYDSTNIVVLPFTAAI